MQIKEKGQWSLNNLARKYLVTQELAYAKK